MAVLTLVSLDVLNHKNYHLLPKDTECVTKKISFRIMGGKNADLGEFPWAAILLLRRNNRKPSTPFCGGSIVNRNYILTAAHCVDSYKISNNQKIFVRLGEHDLKKSKDCEDNFCSSSTQELEVAEIIVHAKYDHLRDYNDIALLRLNEPINYDGFVSPICLPVSCSTVDKDLDGALMVVVGWGNIMDVPVRRNKSVLQKLWVRGYPQSECQKLSPDKVLVPSQLCAIGKVREDACQGDSGGPLAFLDVLDNNPPRYVQVGLVSEGYECAKERTHKLPGVYTKVGHFMDWILDNIYN